jgi:crotonobetaine/carnitine-CoA ligase
MLADEDGFEVPVGSPGELLVRPEEPSVLMDGYWGLPQESLAALREQWFHTGDILRRDEDGWYYFVGRRKDIVRRRGENISAAEVEQVLEMHPGVLECAVIGVPSEVTEEDLMAWIVPRAGVQLEPEEFVQWCAGRMAAFMVPRYLRFVDEMPKTPTEKPEKVLLRQQGSAGAWDREAHTGKEKTR